MLFGRHGSAQPEHAGFVDGWGEQHDAGYLEPLVIAFERGCRVLDEIAHGERGDGAGERIERVKNRLLYGTRSVRSTAAFCSTNGPSRPMKYHANDQTSPTIPSAPNAQCQEIFTTMRQSNGAVMITPTAEP